MRCEIFVVSFSRDVEFLRYALKSIRRFATGFAGITVVVPDQDDDLFAWVYDYGAKLRTFNECPGKGMLHHEYQVMIADRWCPFADAILHMDSDCMFWEPVTPADYFVDGRPILYRERYATLTNKLRLNWKKAVFDATEIDCDWDCMTRLPIVHLPETYKKAREIICDHTQQTVESYILSCRNEFPQSYAEFNTLGSVAIAHFPERYHFVDYDVRTPDGGYDYVRGKDRMTCGWSHGGIERYRKEWDEILGN
jgi:hypothetical protein